MTPQTLRNAGGPGAPSRQPPNPKSTPEPDSWEAFRGVGDPDQRYSLWRLCPCPTCDGTGKRYDNGTNQGRCVDCRGEGRVKQLVATCATPEAVGVALVTLGREGEWDDCPVGCLDSEGEPGRKWIVRPWERSPRNVSDAGRLLRHQRDIESVGRKEPS